MYSRLAPPETPKNLVDINTIINTCVASDIPTLTIDQNINWLARMRKDIEFTIDQLTRIKNARDNAQKHRDKLNSVAKQFYDDDALDMDRNTRILIIIQRLGCNKEHANAICDLIESWCTRKKRDNRNEEICLKYATGKSKASLAREFGISRQHIYNIIGASHRYCFNRKNRTK
jgi:hypothetical protein